MDLNFKIQYIQYIFRVRFKNNQNMESSNHFSKIIKAILFAFILLMLFEILILLRFILDIHHIFIMQFYYVLSNIPSLFYTIPATHKILISLILFFIKMSKTTIHSFQKNIKFHLLFHYSDSIVQFHHHLNLIHHHLNLIHLASETENYQ